MFALRAPQSWFRWFFVLRVSSYATLPVFCVDSHLPQTQDLLSRFTGQLSRPYKPESEEAVAGIYSSSGPMLAGELGMPSSGEPPPPKAPVHSTWKDAQIPYPRRPEQEDGHKKKRLRPTQATATTLLRASFEPQPINDAARVVNSDLARATEERDIQSFKEHLPGSVHRAETIPVSFQPIVFENARSSLGINARTAEPEFFKPEFFKSPNSYVAFKWQFVGQARRLPQDRADTIYASHRGLGSIELSHLQLESQHESLKHELTKKWGINYLQNSYLKQRLELVDHITKAVLRIMRIMNRTFEPNLCENENELLWYEVEAFKTLWALWNEFVFSECGKRAINMRLSQAERTVSRTEEFGLEKSIANKLSHCGGKASINALTWLAVEFTLCNLMLPLYQQLRGGSTFSYIFKQFIDDMGISHALDFGVQDIETIITFKKPFILKQDCLTDKERTWLLPAQQASYRYWARYFHPKQPNIAMALASEVSKTLKGKKHMFQLH